MMKFLSVLCLLSTALNAQELHIRSIQIDGLKTTKEATVLRELSFSVGDRVIIQELHSLLEENKSNLLNQWLFNFIDFPGNGWLTKRPPLLTDAVMAYIYLSGTIFSAKYPLYVTEQLRAIFISAEKSDRS